jgi:DNA sulfur modification protein DndB
VVVILFKFNTQTSRKIFTKVNKYAKPTTKAQNLITDDDDVIAVITRKIANDMIGTRMVNFKSNTLANNSVEFTTLATLYECISIIVDAIHGKIDKTSRPDKAKERLYTQSAEENFSIAFKPQ